MLLQLPVALVVTGSQVPVGLRRCNLGACCVGCKFVVLRIQLRQQLAGLDPLASLNLPVGNFSRHAKAQSRFHTRPNFCSVLITCSELVYSYCQDSDCPNGLRRRFRFGTGRQQHHGTQQQDSPCRKTETRIAHGFLEIND